MTDSFSLQHIIATWDHNILFSCTHTVTVTTDLTVWRLRSDLDYDFFHKLLLCHFDHAIFTNYWWKLTLVHWFADFCAQSEPSSCCTRTNTSLKWWRNPAITAVKRLQSRTSLCRQSGRLLRVLRDAGVQGNHHQCFNIIEVCCYVMTISSALMCLYSRHVPRRRCDCCDLPGGQGSLNDNS